MIEKEKTILRNLDKRTEVLEVKIQTLNKKLEIFDEKLDKFALEFNKKIDHIGGKMVSFEGRMDRFEESNRKIGILLERLDTKFDFAIEGYGSLKTLIEGMNERLTTLEGFA